MLDGFESRLWAENHHLLSDALAELAKNTAYAFERFRVLGYRAPWDCEPAPRETRAH